MSFFKIFKKDPEPKNNLPQAPQESPLKLKYESQPINELDSLNSLIKNFKSDKTKFISYEDYFENEKNLILNKGKEKRVFYKNELDYLYEKKMLSMKKDPKPAKTNIEKMKVVGKIYTSNQTCFEVNEAGRNNFNIKFNKLKIEAKSNYNSFLSLMANNCVISGKWCYEVTLLTNGLFQIGFCQLNTPFSRHMGVGDDKSSYGFDGYRKVSWNGEKKLYGKFWDIGDVVGVCIDFDKRSIEYFLNGEPLGVAFNNIAKGENIAYFPALSLMRGEACIFNFGQLPFKYEYKNYQSFDTPMSKVNGIDSIISELLQIWGKNILPLIESSKLSDYQILLLNSDIFNLLSQYVNDIYIFNQVIIPFLIELKTGKLSSFPENNNYSFSQFIISILDFIIDKEKQKNSAFQIYENLSIEILENALRMAIFMREGEIPLQKKLNYWDTLMKVFISLLKCDKITSLLFQSESILEVFRNIFNSNWLHQGEMIEFVLSKEKNIKMNQAPIKLTLNEIRKEYFTSRKKYYYKINEVISKQLSSLILLFLKDTRKLYDGKILKDKFNDLIRYGYSMNEGNEVIFNMLGIGSKINKQEQVFLRNIFMNLIYMFDENFIKMKFEDIATHPWFYRTDPNSVYFDEVGIGGTISHVTSEYSHFIKEEMKIKTDEFGHDFFHKIIHMTNNIFVCTALKKFDELYSKIKTTPISECLETKDNGTTSFNAYIRNIFYVFPFSVQVALYKFAFFIIKYLMYLIKKNDYIIYFIPASMTEIPFAIFKLLINLKSMILYDSTFRQNINKCSQHFENDDFVKNIVEFYLILFADEKIANPELKEGFLRKVNFLLEKQIIEEFYEENNKIFELLIKGLLKDIKVDVLSHSASKILLKLITPICFGYKIFSKYNKKQKNKYFYNTNKNNQNTKKGVYQFKEEMLVDKLKKYFEGNFNILEEFLKSYGSILNKVMTNYSMALSSIIEIGVARLDLNNIEANRYLLGKHGQPQSDRALYQGLSSSYNEMCQLLKIYEFLLLIYPDEFLDTKKLNYLNFINVLKNISTRILSKPYIDHMLQLIKNINPKINPKVLSEKNRIELYQIGLSLAGIFIQIHKWRKKNKFYESFCKETANAPDFNIEPFNVFMKYVISDLKNLAKTEKPDDIIKEIDTDYYPMIEYLLSLRDVKELTNEEMDSLISEDKLCILCYENPSNTELIPCKHRCCSNCYNQYKIDKDICFICQKKIESVNTLKLK